MAIPEEFHCTKTGLPFHDCMICSEPLEGGGLPYLVEKAMRQHIEYKITDVVFEYAMCINCAMDMQEKISEESRKNIDDFFRSKSSDPDSANPLESAKDGTNSCAITGTNKSECDHYQLFALCQNGSLVPKQAPYMISGKVLAELQDLLSDETRDEFDDFTETFLGPSPEFEDLFRPKTIPFL